MNWPCNGVGGGEAAVKESALQQPSQCRILGAPVMHRSEVVNGEPLGGDEHHTGWESHCGCLLRRWCTLMEPIYHLRLQAGALGVQLVVDLDLAFLYGAYISVKKDERKNHYKIKIFTPTHSAQFCLELCQV